MDRRYFLKLLGIGAGALFASRALGGASPSTSSQPHEASFYETFPDGRVQCTLCPWQCITKPGQRGICEVRENRDGKYYTLVYSNPCAVHIDPIEKKPLFHYLPGTLALSIATVGCNIECRYCCPTIAYTYTEPVIFYEYMYDTASLSRKQGIGGVMISNGFINPEPMRKLCKVLTAVKIDFKGFSEDFYRNVCNARLKPVLDTLTLLAEEGIWFELVVLILPGLNDSTEMLKGLSQWIKKNLGENVPTHFSRFYPAYKMRNLPPTPVKTLETAYQIARDAGLNFVYIGNVPGHRYESTYCPSCNELLIHRVGYAILENKLRDGKCPKCGKQIPGVWQDPLKGSIPQPTHPPLG